MLLFCLLNPKFLSSWIRTYSIQNIFIFHNQNSIFRHIFALKRSDVNIALTLGLPKSNVTYCPVNLFTVKLILNAMQLYNETIPIQLAFTLTNVQLEKKEITKQDCLISCQGRRYYIFFAKLSPVSGFSWAEMVFIVVSLPN